MMENIEKELYDSEYYKEQLINPTTRIINYSDTDASKKINVQTFTTKYGKIRGRELSNTKLGNYIARTKTINFGSVGDFSIDAIPNSLIRSKGTEVTWVSSDSKCFRNKQLISRRFLSKICQFWSYMVGIRYDFHKGEMNGLWEWGTMLKLHNTNEHHTFLSGGDAIAMLKDILFVIRNKNIKNINKFYNDGRISKQLYNILIEMASQKNNSIENTLMEMKYRVYYDYKLDDKVWSYPKVRVNYLFNLIKEINNGDYLTDILVPVIHNLHTYPIICKDTHVKPMSTEEHENNTDDYDLTQYVFERN